MIFYVLRLFSWTGILILCLSYQAQGESFAGPNLALGKPAWQSSTSDEGFAERAIDGNRNTDYYGGSSCTHAHPTNEIQQPWWIVDLQSEYEISHVVITNRGDGSVDRLTNFTVAVGNTFDSCLHFNPKTLAPCVHVPGKLAASETRTLPCDEPLRGRFVTVYLNQPDTLQICELEVYGSLVSGTGNNIDDNTEDLWCLSQKSNNLALKKPTWQSSNYDTTRLADRAVDGSHNTDAYDGGSCTVTNKTDKLSWWVVDLQSEYMITELVITNRKSNAYATRLHNFTVAVGDKFSQDNFNPKNFTLCAHVPGKFAAAETRTLRCKEPVIGRYVTVYLNEKDYLQLCEVEVYGKAASEEQEITEPRLKNTASVTHGNSNGATKMEQIICIVVWTLGWLGFLGQQNLN